MTTPPDVVATHGLTRTFGETVAVDGVSLTVQKGEIFGILGHNGAGKTTLLRLVTGLLRPTAGSVRTFGADPSDDAVAIRRRTGAVTESTALDDFLTVRENLVAHAMLYGVDRDRIEPTVASLVGHFGLAGMAARPVRGLSAGLRQRAAFARALVHDPDLLLLDEPTANLDPVAAHGVRRTLAGLVRSRGCTVVLSTHNLAEAQAVCDRVAILEQGRVRLVGTVDELTAEVAGDLATRVRTRPGHVDRAAAVLAEFGDPDSDGDPEGLVVRHGPTVDVGAMVERLVAAGVPVLEVTPVGATLEHVYLDLHHGQEHA